VDKVAPRALVFDLDGTVWDSRPWLARAISGGAVDAERQALASLRDNAPAARLLHAAGVTTARFRTICDEASDLSLYPGVRETLSALQDEGTALGVVTNLPGWIASPMLDCVGLGEFFGSVIAFSRTRPSKPHPAPIQASLEDLGIEPVPGVWYVGDADSDAEAARRASVSFAWASYGYGSDKPANADAVLHDFSQALEL
jgi:phosphoglycolate phosphatase